MREAQVAARTLGLDVVASEIRRPEDIAPAFDADGTRCADQACDVKTQARARDGLGLQGCSPSWHKAYTA